MVWSSLIGNQTDNSNAVKHLREGIRGCKLPFETVAKEFHFIDNATCTIYIPNAQSETLCKKIEEGTANRSDYRLAGQYSVSVYEQHFKALLQTGDIRPVGENAAILSNSAIYDTCKGLAIPSDTGKAVFI